jgi:hypothetical protein
MVWYNKTLTDFGLHMLKPRASEQTCRSDCFRSDSCRISSESDIFHKKTDRIRHSFCRILFDRNLVRISSEFNGTQWNPTRSNPDFIGFRRIQIERNPTVTVSDPIPLFDLRTCEDVFKNKVKERCIYTDKNNRTFNDNNSLCECIRPSEKIIPTMYESNIKDTFPVIDIYI